MRQPFRYLAVLAVTLLTIISTSAADKLNPTYAGLSYGEHPHQVMDVYLPESKEGQGTFPVLIWYGGIWKPTRHAPDPKRWLLQGVAVIAVGTRTLTDGMEDKVEAPVSYVMLDACRVVQFIRLNANKWHLNAERIALGGSSQGALPALYVGCAGDQADTTSDDPVKRMSTRVTCVVAHRSQPSIDPLQMQEWVSGVKWGAPALGMGFEESLKRRDELLPLIEKWSPDALIHKEAAPVYFENNWGMTQPDGVTVDDYKVHSPAWGLGFQKKAQAAGMECYVKYPDHSTPEYQDYGDFILKKLKS